MHESNSSFFAICNLDDGRDADCQHLFVAFLHLANDFRKLYQTGRKPMGANQPYSTRTPTPDETASNNLMDASPTPSGDGHSPSLLAPTSQIFYSIESTTHIFDQDLPTLTQSTSPSPTDAPAPATVIHDYEMPLEIKILLGFLFVCLVIVIIYLLITRRRHRATKSSDRWEASPATEEGSKEEESSSGRDSVLTQATSKIRPLFLSGSKGVAPARAGMPST